MIASLPAIFKSRAPRRPRLKRHGAQAALIIGDEGYRVASLRPGLIGKDHYVAAGDDGRASVYAWLKTSKIKRLRIVSDQTGQSYSREDIPKATRRDREQILKRRLVGRFGGDALTTSLEIDGANQSGETNSTASYLLASLANETDIATWLDELADAQIEVESISLLPLEWAAFLPTLLDPLSSDTDDETWRVVVTRHRTGGVRHVILRGRQLILTRLTRDLADAPSTTENGGPSTRWDGHLHAEIEASIGYIKRFGYTTNQKLLVSLIGGQSFVDVVDEINRASSSNWQAHRIEDLLTGLDVALPVQAGDDDRADRMIATIMSGLAVQHPLSSPQWRSLQQHRHQTVVVRLAAAAAIIGLIGSSAWLGLELVEQDNRNREARAKLDQLEQERAELNAIANELPSNLQDLRDFVQAYEKFYLFEQDFRDLHGAILRALGSDIRLDRLTWQVMVEDQNSASLDAEVALNLDLNLAAGVPEAVSLADRFLADLVEHLPEHDLEVISQEVPIALADQGSGTWSASQPTEVETPMLDGQIALRTSKPL